MLLFFVVVLPAVDAITEGWGWWPWKAALHAVTILAWVAATAAVGHAARWGLRRRVDRLALA